MRLILLFIVFLFFSCRGEKRYEDFNLTEYQREVNNYFKDASVSPLKAKDLKNFKGLDFFEFDSSYVCLLYTSPSPRDKRQSRMPSSA